MNLGSWSMEYLSIMQIYSAVNKRRIVNFRDNKTTVIWHRILNGIFGKFTIDPLGRHKNFYTMTNLGDSVMMLQHSKIFAKKAAFLAIVVDLHVDVTMSNCEIKSKRDSISRKLWPASTLSVWEKSISRKSVSGASKRKCLHDRWKLCKTCRSTWRPFYEIKIQVIATVQAS